MIDPFVSEYMGRNESAGSHPAVYSLYELNRLVGQAVSCALPNSYWVAAEISELRVAVNGHCYVEFVQKDENGISLMAKARGNIWKNSYTAIKRTFENETGQSLSAGIKVLVCVSVAFHEMYGYSLTVLDIDPTYTLGDMERRRREILAQLEEDGVIHLNQELSMPRVLRRIAVISSPTAAGYGDFCKQLEQSGYIFDVCLFPAIMQGEKVEKSVIAALDRIALEADNWDVVVLIRGGGATTDLSGFDTYLLAANVAQFPLPVLSGIGHERDETIIDFVAHARLKTPTAVAVYLIDSRKHETAGLQDLQIRLIRAVQESVLRDRRQLDETVRRLNRVSGQSLTDERRYFDVLSHRFELAVSRYVAAQHEHLYRQSAKFESMLHHYLADERQSLALLPHRFAAATTRYLDQQHYRQTLLAQQVKLAGPERILALGYSMTLKNGKPVSQADQLLPGDIITTKFQDGEIVSRVE